MSLYIEYFQEAIAFYTQVFGAPESIAENKAIYGWRMGATWLTVFPGKVGSSPNNNPRNAEFAVQVSTLAEVDLLHQALIDAASMCIVRWVVIRHNRLRTGITIPEYIDRVG